MSLFVTSETSPLQSLLFLLPQDSCSGGPGSGSSYVHCVWVSIERIPPLHLRMPLIFVSFEPVTKLDVFFLVESRRVGPIIPIDRMVELDAVDHKFWW